MLRSLRRLGRALFVLNPAAVWLYLQGKGRFARSYCAYLWTLYLWPDMVPVSGEARLSARPVQDLFPDIDLARIDLLHPLPRPGGVRLDELVLLCAIVRHVKPRRIVEIGTAEGRTTLNLANSAPAEAEVISLDLPPDAQSAAPDAGPDYRQLSIDEPGMLLDHPLRPKIRLVRADSTTYNWSEYERSVDLVFIDGGHDEVTVAKDTENALRIIRPGGVILWHDYNVHSVPGVTRCLNALRDRVPVVWLEETTLASAVVRE